MKSKKWLVAALGVAMLGGASLTSHPVLAEGKPEAAAKDPLKEALSAVADDLKMTPAQRAEALPILEDTVKEAKGIVGSATAPLEKRDKLMALRKSSHDKLASILTPPQLDELEVKRDVIRQQVQAALWGQRGR